MGHNSAGFHWIFHFHFPLKKVEYQPNYSFCELFILLRIVNLDGLTFLTALCSQMDVFSLVAGKGQRKFHSPRSDALPLSQRDSIMIEPITKFIHDASTLVTRRKTSFSVSSPCSKPYCLSYSIYKHDAIDIPDPSSTRDACHTWISWWASLTIESLGLSGRASERGIRRSKVPFFMRS